MDEIEELEEKYIELLLSRCIDLENNSTFRRDRWNENAKNNGSFLFLISLEPNYLDGIDFEKIKKAE